MKQYNLFPNLPEEREIAYMKQLDKEEAEARARGFVACPSCCLWVEQEELRQNGGICRECADDDI